MAATSIPKIVGCVGIGIANPASQPATDPALTVTLETQDGRIYVLPLSDRAAGELFQVLANWHTARDFIVNQGLHDQSTKH